MHAPCRLVGDRRRPVVLDRSENIARVGLFPSSEFAEVTLTFSHVSGSRTWQAADFECFFSSRPLIKGRFLVPDIFLTSPVIDIASGIANRLFS